MAKKSGDKYQTIIEAAVKIIARHGYHQAQVSKIAREANVADGTIYLYFKNKEDILTSLFHEKMGGFIDYAQEQIDLQDKAEDKLRELIRIHLTLLTSDPDLAIVTQIELRQSDPEIRQRIGVTMKKYFDLIDSLIKEGIKQGMFRDDIDIGTIRRLIFGTLDETVTAWVMKNQKYDLTRMIQPIHSLIIHGLMPRK